MDTMRNLEKIHDMSSTVYNPGYRKGLSEETNKQLKSYCAQHSNITSYEKKKAYLQIHERLIYDFPSVQELFDKSFNDISNKIILDVKERVDITNFDKYIIVLYHCVELTDQLKKIVKDHFLSGDKFVMFERFPSKKTSNI